MSAVNTINCPSAVSLSAANSVFQDAHIVSCSACQPECVLIYTLPLTDLCERSGAHKTALDRYFVVVFVVFYFVYVA